ncbi:LuxR C-terminal-related transcriptional regulator [Acidisarcina polymorpha]|uniref:LuxR C-terminal-related transcriptional regulator n=1 Tax=Acidisarcina polymorpha TaxID=2211140 RepID=UPI000DEFFDB5
MPSRPVRSEVTFQSPSEIHASRRALIVDRDSMSSQLLADALVRNRKFEASPILSSELLKRMAVREIGLIVIGAELKSGTTSGLSLADLVSRTYPHTSIVILLDQVSRTSVISAFRAGARGVFSRQQPMTEFLECIDCVRKGVIWAGKSESSILLEAFRNIPAPVLSAAGSVHTLTMRELQVVQKAAQGKTNRTIAQELSLSEHTVKNYLFRAFEKLGVSSRIELLFYLTIRGHTFGEHAAGASSSAAPTVEERPGHMLSNPGLVGQPV